MNSSISRRNSFLKSTHIHKDGGEMELTTRLGIDQNGNDSSFLTGFTTHPPPCFSRNARMSTLITRSIMATTVESRVPSRGPTTSAKLLAKSDNCILRLSHPNIDCQLAHGISRDG
ncbi:hypothetical protein ACLKA6_007304 [Drosophila palustris]